MIYLFLSLIIILFVLALSLLVSRFLYPKTFVTGFLSKDISTTLKGFSILLIMLSHIGNLFGIRYLNPLGSWGVGVFLFLSGFGLQKSYNQKRLKGYWPRRLLNSYLPYLIFEIAGFAFFYKVLSFKSILLDVFLIDPLHPFGWYMQCVFIYYILFFIFSLLFKNKELIKVPCILFCSLLLFFFLKHLFREQLWMFPLGVLISLLPKAREFVQNKWYLGFVAFFIGIVFLVAKQISFIRDLNYLIDYITSFEVLGLSVGSLILLNYVSNRCQIIGYAFYGVGLISFELYLVHHLAVLPISFLTIFHFWLASMIYAFSFFIIRKFLYSLPDFIKRGRIFR